MAFVLEPEQELLFTQLVEAVRSVPRTDRQPFMAIRRMGGDILQGNGYSGRVLNEDLVALSDTGLIRITNYHDRGGGFNFVIPPTALAYYEDLKSSGREPTEQIEQEVLSYLDALSFQERYRWPTPGGRMLSSCFGNRTLPTNFQRSVTSAARDAGVSDGID